MNHSKCSFWGRNAFLLICAFLATSKMDAQQLSQIFTYTGSIATWTVPNCVSQVTIMAVGAQGGSNDCAGAPGGFGASMQGTFSVTPGQTLQVLVGEQGSKGGINNTASGGGGSFVTDISNNPLIVAGGGGGGGYDLQNDANASMSTSGNPGGGNCQSGSGGTNGGGGGGGNAGSGGGGGGFYGNGGTGTVDCMCGNPGTGGSATSGSDGTGTDAFAYGGASFINGGAGGVPQSNNGPNGGYGGGGSAYSFNCAGGGGGGYSGGGGGGYDYSCSDLQSCCGGGGGSYNVGAYQINFVSSQIGNGMVIIFWNQGINNVNVAINTINNVTCNGGSDGSIAAVVYPSNLQYTYSWRPSGQTTDTISGLSSGLYVVTVHDACGDSAFVSATVGQPAPLGIEATAAANVTCNGGNNGLAVTQLTGGTTPFVYTWTSGSTTDTASALSMGTYSITVGDACGATASASVTITQPNVLNPGSVILTTTNVTCNGGNNGTASLQLLGGGAPFAYFWSPSGQTNAKATGLYAGTYTVTVEDACGASATVSGSISQPTPIMVSENVTANVTCHNGINGSISSLVSGGISPYTYLWSNGLTVDTATGLSAGMYTLNITDNNGCHVSKSALVIQPVALGLSANAVANLTCYGGDNGTAFSRASGGTVPYNYFWSNGETNANVSALSAGTYTITTTDVCGSSVTALVNITQPAPVNGSFAVVQNIACNGDNNACAAISANGGTVPYSYLWSDGNSQTTAAACGLSAGTYTVNITDKNGCTGVATAAITQPATIQVVTRSTADNGTCNGSAEVTVSGGTSPYIYSWINGDANNSISNQCAGSYCCIITDADGCSKDACVVITNTTGVAGISSVDGNVAVYPNPNNGQFTIESSVTKGSWAVEIYNVLGEKVYSQFNIQNPAFNVNLNNQAGGVYLYRIMNENGTLLGEGKIIVQK